MLALVAFLWFLVPDLDQAVDENLSVPDDGAEGRLAGEDVFERAAVGREGVEVQALRVGAVAEELRDPDRGVLGGGGGVGQLSRVVASRLWHSWLAPRLSLTMRSPVSALSATLHALSAEPAVAAVFVYCLNLLWGR